MYITDIQSFYILPLFSESDHALLGTDFGYFGYLQCDVGFFYDEPCKLMIYTSNDDRMLFPSRLSLIYTLDQGSK